MESKPPLLLLVYHFASVVLVPRKSQVSLYSATYWNFFLFNSPLCLFFGGVDVLRVKTLHVWTMFNLESWRLEI